MRLAEIVRAQPIEALFAEHRSGREDHGNRLWLLLNSELWYRMAIEGQNREDLRAELSELQTTSTRSAAVAA